MAANSKYAGPYGIPDHGVSDYQRNTKCQSGERNFCDELNQLKIKFND